MIKCNTDEVAKGSPKPFTCGGLFGNRSVVSLGCFTISLGINNDLFAKHMDTILAIEIVFDKEWHKLWLECDLNLVVVAFHNLERVP